MSRTHPSRVFCWLLTVAALIAPVPAARADEPEVEGTASSKRPEDLLREIVVASGTAGHARRLPKLGFHPTLAADESDITLRNVVRRDLDLSGEYEVMAEPSESLLSDASVDVVGWKTKGAEAVVQLFGKTQANGKVSLDALAWLTESPDAPIYKQHVEVEATQVRVESHRLADAIIGALTGTAGGFSSEMSFVFGHGKARRVYVIDSDGHDPYVVSPPDQLALAPAFGPNHRLFWTGSSDQGAFNLFEAGDPNPIALLPRGSVYGIAFSREYDKVAVSIARSGGIKMFTGPDLDHLRVASSNDLAMHPTWSPNGKLGFVGETKTGTHVFVDGKPISPSGLMASAPVFCRHPDGVRAVYTVGVGKKRDIVTSGEQGGSMLRLTTGGTSRHPACSPDGRLIAFFSTGAGGEGPGLYIMHLDGSRAKRISTLLGESLRWARAPLGKVKRFSVSK